MHKVKSKAFDGKSFLNEQQFKRFVIKMWKDCNLIPFEIENEEKVKGFPDVLVFCPDNTAFLAEFKKAKDGNVVFQKSQPLFYATYASKLDIEIWAWDERTGSAIFIDPKEVKSNVVKIKDNLPELWHDLGREDI